MTDKLLTFLKLLADATRLNILGLLAQEPRSVDEIAAVLNLNASTVSHHLTRLQKVGLVAARAEQYYHIYALNAEVWQQYITQLTIQQLASRAKEDKAVNDEAYTRQIMARWIKDEHLHSLPSQIKHRQVVLQWLAEKFEPDKRYDWDQVHEVLEAWCDESDPHRLDTGTVLRWLVNSQLLSRMPNGSWHWRTDSLLTQVENFDPLSLPIAEVPTTHRFTMVRATADARHLEEVYADLAEKGADLNPQRKLVELAMRIDARKHHTESDIDALIRRYNDQEPTIARAALLQEGLIEQADDGTYWRTRITPDHPAVVKLRETRNAGKKKS